MQLATTQTAPATNTTLKSRLIESARVIEGQICYEIKNADQIYELCYNRFSLHKRIYNHKTSAFSSNVNSVRQAGDMLIWALAARAIEHMIVDALLAAEPVLKFTEDVFIPEKFLYLTDDLMALIERTTQPVSPWFGFHYQCLNQSPAFLVLGIESISRHNHPHQATTTVQDGRQ